jgi:protein phosphatase PTC7
MGHVRQAAEEARAQRGAEACRQATTAGEEAKQQVRPAGEAADGAPRGFTVSGGTARTAPARVRSLGASDPLSLLILAHRRTRVLGSSTACVLALEPDFGAPSPTDAGDDDSTGTLAYKLTAVNLGDSGFVVVRDGKLIFKSPAQQHGFNFPFQLAATAHSDAPEQAQTFDLPVRRGDAVVMGTDGLFDNMFDEEIVATLAKGRAEGLPPDAIAMRLARRAHALAADGHRMSPFAQQAQAAGYSYRGGKMDDCTVIVSLVELGGAKKDQQDAGLPRAKL